MKIITSISRIIVGLLFIFSGVIKSNDPKGTAIKFNEYFDVFASSFEVSQDTLRYQVTDSLGTDERVEHTLVAGDVSRKIEFNQSAPRMELFEGDEDSTYGCEVFLISNGNILYNAFYETGDSVMDPVVNISMSVSSGKVLLDTSFTLRNDTRHAYTAEADLSQHIKKVSFWVGFFRSLKPYSIHLSIIMCILEVVLGFTILIGWKPRVMSWLILLLILFFTFLTWYSAYFNKVTDCGCFGDFIKLKPWHSFFKDVVLLFFILIIFLRRKKIIPLFSPLFSINAVIVVTLASSVFAIYCNMFLPAWDFLPYKSGNNIREMMKLPPGEREKDSMVMVYLYKKNNQVDSFVYPDLPSDPAYTYVDRIDRIIVPAWKSPIHDFEFIRRDEQDISIKDSLLHSKSHSVLIVSTQLDKSHKGSWDQIRKMATEVTQAGIRVYAVTSTSLDKADAFALEKNLPFRFNNADETLLKTVVRSNPGIMFWHDGKIIDKWSCRSIPSARKLKRLMRKSK